MELKRLSKVKFIIHEWIIFYIVTTTIALKSEKCSPSPSCIFPFEYKGKAYNECINVGVDYYWCSLNKKYSTTRYKKCHDCEKVICKPPHGCVFPFEYEGKNYTECTQAGSNSFRRRYWCSKDKTYKKNWSSCECEEVTCTAPKECDFPFVHNGKKYTECTMDESPEYWCLNKYNNKSSSCSCENVPVTYGTTVSTEEYTSITKTVSFTSITDDLTTMFTISGVPNQQGSTDVVVISVVIILIAIVIFGIFVLTLVLVRRKKIFVKGKKHGKRRADIDNNNPTSEQVMIEYAVVNKNSKTNYDQNMLLETAIKNVEDTCDESTTKHTGKTVIDMTENTYYDGDEVTCGNINTNFDSSNNYSNTKDTEHELMDNLYYEGENKIMNEPNNVKCDDDNKHQSNTYDLLRDSSLTNPTTSRDDDANGYNSNYMYTYGHFKLEKRERSPAHLKQIPNLSSKNS